MGRLVGGSTSSGGSGGSTTTTYAPLPTSGLVVAFTTNDSTQAITLTGKRFYFEYLHLVATAHVGTALSVGMGWSGATLSGVTMAIEYTQSGGVFLRNMTSGGSGMLAGASPVMVATGGVVGAGPCIVRGVIDFTASTAVTLTPALSAGGTSGTVYNRSFRVDTIA